MKRLVIITILAVISTAAMAQDYLGVQVGYAQPTSRLNSPVNKNTLTPTNYHGMKLGFVYDGTIFKGFGVSMGLNYTFAGNTTDWVEKAPGYSTVAVRSKDQLHQLEIVVDWQYKFEIAKNTWVMLYSGPSLQCGLSMNNKWYERYGKDIKFTTDNNVYSVEDMKDFALKRLNVTWGVGAGFQYDRYFLRGGYDFGIINPYKAYQFEQTINDGNPRTRGRFDQWQIKLGVYLWQSK